jgi:hypothetical protein
MNVSIILAQMLQASRILICFALIGLIGCAKSVTPSTGGRMPTNSKTPTKGNKTPDGSYDEDLSVYRPKYNKKKTDVASSTTKTTGNTSTKSTPTDKPMHVNQKLDEASDAMANKNKNIKFANGFRIQIYVGNDKKSADDVKINIYQNFQELNPYISYNFPTYKIRVGDFLNRMDAERYLTQLKETYPGSIILPDKVEIKKGMLINSK